MKRGLTYLEAIEYVGVKRRTFDMQWRPHLVAIAQGTSLVFDRADLDRLFDEFKQNAAARVRGERSGSAPWPASRDCPHPAEWNEQGPRAEVSSLEDRRPTSRKGAEQWVVKTASTKTQRASGTSTSSTAVNAFKAVSDRIRKPRLG